MQTEASSRSLYAGLDLHKRNVFCAIKDHTGKPIYCHRLPTELPLILQALDAYRSQLKAVAVESTFNWYWLVDGLQAAGYPVRLANPAKMAVYDGLKQTDDQTDALWIAELARLGILPEGYIYPKAERPIRDMLRRRMLIVRQATQTLLSVQSMVTRQTGQAVSSTKLQQWTRVEVGECFADSCSQQTAAAMLELWREQRRIQHELEKPVRAVMKLQGPFRRLLTIPGIGDILGMTITLETGPIARFASAGRYASYCRAVDSRRESDEKKQGENNRKNGNKYLSWAFVEAAHRGRVVAVKALACKLAKAAYYVLRDDVDFEEKKMFG
jgi:transposase